MKAKLSNLLVFCIIVFVNTSYAATKLNQEFNGTFGASESKFLFNLNGNRVLYTGFFAPDNFERLFAVLPNGEKRVALSENLVPAGDIDEFSNTADGKMVVYRAEKNAINRSELFSVPIEGGIVTKLNVSLVANGTVLDFQMAGSNVVYLADAITDEKFELFSVPVNGPVNANIKLNQSLGASDDVFPDYQLSTARDRVVFRTTAGLNLRLLSSPVRPEIEGNPIVLDSTGDALDFKITTDDRVVLISDQNTLQTRLFSIPISGGNLTQISGSLVPSGNVTTFQVAPDGNRAVYSADALVNDVFELFSVPIEGGDVIKLNQNLVAGGNVINNFQITSDSQHVVYEADAAVNDVIELFSVPLLGGNVVKLNPNLVGGGDVLSFSIAPDSSRVAFLADVLVNDRFELFSAPVTGGPAVLLNQDLVAGGDVSIGFEISPDSSRVAFIADALVDDAFELFSAPIGGGEVIRINDNLVNNGDVFDFQINFNGSRITYRADQQIDNKRELFISTLTPLLSDYDNNGQNDILLRKGNQLKILTQDLNNNNALVTKTINTKIKGKIILANDLNQDGKPDLVIKKGKNLVVNSVNDSLDLAQTTLILPNLPKREKFLASGRLKGFTAFVSGKKRDVRVLIENDEIAKLKLPKKSKVLGIGIFNNVHHLIIRQKQGKKEEIKAFPFVESDIKQFTLGSEISLGELPKGQKAISLITVPRLPDVYAVVKFEKNYLNLVLPLNNAGFIMGENIKGKFVGPK